MHPCPRSHSVFAPVVAHVWHDFHVLMLRGSGPYLPPCSLDGVRHNNQHLALVMNNFGVQSDPSRSACSELETEALAGTDTTAPLTHAHLLDAFDARHGHANSYALVATALAWHSCGHALTVAYGVPHSPGFCAAPGLLCQWSHSRDAVTPSQPQLRLHTDCALSAVACHPQRPAVIAAGTANGGVLVWDVAADAADALIGRSNTGTLDVGHQQCVQTVAWVRSAAEEQRHSDPAMACLLCTVGRCESCGSACSACMLFVALA